MLDRYELLGWVLDFEGSLGLKRTLSQGRVNHSYTPYVRMGTGSLEHLQFFQRRIQLGTVNPWPNPRDNANDAFDWYLTTPEIEEHLVQIRPFLFLKHEQAGLILHYLQLRDSTVLEHRGSYAPDQLALFQSLYLECKALNERKVRPLSPAELFHRQLRRR